MLCSQDSCGFLGQRSSIPAHLLSSCRSHPNPAKGVRCQLHLRWVYSARLAGTNQDYLSVLRFLCHDCSDGSQKRKKKGFMSGGPLKTDSGEDGWMKETHVQFLQSYFCLG